MTAAAKNKLDEFFTWVTRALMAITVTLLGYITQRFDRMEINVQDLVSEKKVLVQRVSTLENEVSRLNAGFNDLFRHYDLKPKR